MTVPTVSSGSPTQSSWANQVAAEVNGLIPVGAVWMWLTATPPAGWLLLNGAEISRTGEYAELFAKIGTAGGPGNGTTTWNLPDFRNRFPMGTGPNPSVGLGGTGGSKDAVVPSHSHTASSANETAEHTHSMQGHVHALNHAHALSGGNHSHAMEGDYGFRFAVTWGGQTNERLAAWANGQGTGITFSDVDHENILAPGDGGTALSVQSQNGNSQGPSTGSTGGRSASHTHGVTVNTAGVAATNANLPPYLGINFIVKY